MFSEAIYTMHWICLYCNCLITACRLCYSIAAIEDKSNMKADGRLQPCHGHLLQVYICWTDFLSFECHCFCFASHSIWVYIDSDSFLYTIPSQWFSFDRAWLLGLETYTTNKWASSVHSVQLESLSSHFHATDCSWYACCLLLSYLKLNDLCKESF